VSDLTTQLALSRETLEQSFDRLRRTAVELKASHDQLLDACKLAALELHEMMLVHRNGSSRPRNPELTEAAEKEVLLAIARAENRHDPR
jgi:hypothetical protein